MTEPDFRKTFFSGRKCRKYAGKTSFLAFSRDFIISFSWFFAQKCKLEMLIFFTSNIFNSYSQYFSKIAGTADWRAMKKKGFSSISRVLLNISFMNFFSILSLALSFVCSFVRSFVRSFVFQFLFNLCLCLLSLSNFHHQVGPISIQLVVSFPTKLDNLIN